MRATPHRLTLSFIILVGLALPGISTTSECSSPPRTCELELSLSRTSWTADERIVASLALQNKSSVPIMVVKAWLPSGWTLRRQYLESGTAKHEERSGGITRGATGEFYTARRQPDEYSTIAPQESLKVEVDLTPWLRGQGKKVPEGDYRVVVWYRYKTSKEEEGLPLLDCSAESNEIAFRVSSD